MRSEGKGATLFGYTSLYGSVPGGQAEYLRVPQAQFGPIKIPDGTPGRAVPLPVRRAAHRVAGRRLRRRARGRQRRRVRARPDRADVRPHRQAPRRRARHRHRLGARAAGAGREVRRRAARPVATSTTSSAALLDLVDGRGPDATIDAVGMESHGGAPGGKLASRRAEGDRPAARRGRAEGHRQDRRRPPRRAARRDQGRAPRRHGVDQRRVRRRGRPAADDGDVRPRHPAAHGPGARAPLDRRHPAARPGPGRPARHAGPHHPPPAAGRGARARTRCSATRATAASRWCCKP